MRHNQNRRSRGRGRKAPNPLARSYESNGPDVKVRGNAAHVAEKYSALARDALASGDTIAAENYFQHAEHYNRIVAAAQAQYQQQQPAPQPSGNDAEEEDYGSSNGESRHQPDRTNGGAYQSSDDGGEPIGGDGGRRGRRMARRPRPEGDTDGAAQDPAPADDGGAPPDRRQRPARAEQGAPPADAGSSEGEGGDEDSTRDGTAALAAFPD